MSEADPEVGQVNSKTAFIIAIVILLGAVPVLITAYGYSGGSGIFPRFIGWVFVGLVLLEMVVQLKRMIMLPPSEQNATGFDSHDLGRAKVEKEIQGFLWICFFLLFLYLGGFLVSIPLYMFAFLRFSARRPFKECLFMATGSTLFVYILFIVLMEYRLYPGVFLAG